MNYVVVMDRCHEVDRAHLGAGILSGCPCRDQDDFEKCRVEGRKMLLSKAHLASAGSLPAAPSSSLLDPLTAPPPHVTSPPGPPPPSAPHPRRGIRGASRLITSQVAAAAAAPGAIPDAVAAPIPISGTSLGLANILPTPEVVATLKKFRYVAFTPQSVPDHQSYSSTLPTHLYPPSPNVLFPDLVCVYFSWPPT